MYWSSWQLNHLLLHNCPCYAHPAVAQGTGPGGPSPYRSATCGCKRPGSGWVTASWCVGTVPPAGWSAWTCCYLNSWPSPAKGPLQPQVMGLILDSTTVGARLANAEGCRREEESVCHRDSSSKWTPLSDMLPLR